MFSKIKATIFLIGFLLIIVLLSINESRADHLSYGNHYQHHAQQQRLRYTHHVRKHWYGHYHGHGYGYGVPRTYAPRYQPNYGYYPPAPRSSSSFGISIFGSDGHSGGGFSYQQRNYGYWFYTKIYIKWLNKKTQSDKNMEWLAVVVVVFTTSNQEVDVSQWRETKEGCLSYIQLVVKANPEQKVSGYCRRP